MRPLSAAGLALFSLNSGVEAVPQSYGTVITGTRSYCDSEPCQNGGVCHMKEDNHRGKFFCECQPGWNGPLCEVPNPTLECGNQAIKVTIDKRMLVGRENQAKLVSFGGSEDPACQAKDDGTNYTLEIKSPFSKNCGTTPSRGDNGDYIFANEVIWKKVYEGADESESAIQRQIKLIDFKCKYEDEYLLSMQPIKPAEAVIERKIEKGSFRVDMSLWKNSDFERDVNGAYSSNPIIRVGQQVCVKLELASRLELDNLVLTAANCWAAANDNPTEAEKHKIITKKCTTEEDYTTIVKKNGVDDEVKFCFQVYKWKTAMDNLYVQCQMSICDDSIMFDGSSQCVCPPKSYELNSWFYPNYYDSMLDSMNDYGDYYGYGLYGDDSYYSAPDNYGQTFYYDYISPWTSRKRRSVDDQEEDAATETTNTNAHAQEHGNSGLKNSDDYDPTVHDPEKSSKRKRLEFVGTFKDNETGKFQLPEGIRADAKSDLIDVGYGPITLKDEAEEVASAMANQRAEVVRIAEIDDLEWFESSEGANNVVLMAVGGSLIFAIIVLGVVVGVYVQFSSQEKEKMKVQVDDKQKAKNFFNSVMKAQQEE